MFVIWEGCMFYKYFLYRFIQENLHLPNIAVADILKYSCLGSFRPKGACFAIKNKNRNMKILKLYGQNN